MIPNVCSIRSCMQPLDAPCVHISRPQGDDRQADSDCKGAHGEHKHDHEVPHVANDGQQHPHEDAEVLEPAEEVEEVGQRDDGGHRELLQQT